MLRVTVPYFCEYYDTGIVPQQVLEVTMALPLPELSQAAVVRATVQKSCGVKQCKAYSYFKLKLPLGN